MARDSHPRLQWQRRRAMVMWGGLAFSLAMSFQTILWESVRTTEYFSAVYQSFHGRFGNPTATTTASPIVVQIPEMDLIKHHNLLPPLHVFIVHPPTASLPKGEDEATNVDTFPQIIPTRPLYEFERYWFEDCTWVLDEEKEENPHQTRPTCNDFHELPIVDEDVLGQGVHRSTEDMSLLSMAGSWRSVWNVTRYSPIAGSATYGRNSDSVVMKMLLIERDFNEASFDMHGLDAMVMERLKASPYVVDSYGFCGQSVMTAIGKSSSLHVVKDPKLPWLTRLEIARDLARGMADIHALKPHKFDEFKTVNQTLYKGPLPFAHHDATNANTLVTLDEHLQWNDFNLGIVARHKKNAHLGAFEACPVPIRFKSPLWRSPEEIRNQTGFLNMTENAIQAADVYSMANVFFQIVTKHQPWLNLEDDRYNTNSTQANTTNDIDIMRVRLVTGGNYTDAEKEASLQAIAVAKERGQLPYMPERYLSRPEARLLWDQAQRCYRRDPATRPSALEVAFHLGRVYDMFLDKKKRSEAKN